MIFRTLRSLAVAATMLLLAAPTADAAPVLFTGTGPGGTIPDGSGNNVPGAAFTSVIAVPGAYAGSISAVWVEFDGLAHTFVGDLWVRLIHPDGTTSIDLLSRPGRGSGSTFGFASDFVAVNSYAFSDGGSPLFDVLQPGVIPSGVYVPSSNPNHPASNLLAYAYTPQSFAAVFGGMSAVGNWTLEITDWAGLDTGSLSGWTLNVEVDQVPEPSTLALVGLGCVALVGRVRARRRR